MLKRWDIGVLEEGIEGRRGLGHRGWRNGEDSHNIVYTARDIQIWERGEDSRMTVTEGGGP